MRESDTGEGDREGREERERHMGKRGEDGIEWG